MEQANHVVTKNGVLQYTYDHDVTVGYDRAVYCLLDCWGLYTKLDRLHCCFMHTRINPYFYIYLCLFFLLPCWDAKVFKMNMVKFLESPIINILIRLVLPVINM